MCKVINTLHQNTLGSIYQISKKNTSCTCKVFNTLDLNTWGSIYPTSKQYLLYVQSIQYFAPKYLLGPFNQLRKITSCTCKVFNTLHLNTWGSIYLTLKKYFLHILSIQYFAPIYLGVHISNFEKYILHVQSIQYFAPKYLGVHISNLEKILLARVKYSILCT